MNSIDLSLRELEIEGFNNAETEIKGGTMLVALPVNGSLVTPISATVAPGIYHKLELKVQTVRIRGTFDGQAFDVTVGVDEDLEMSINPPLEVTELSQANLTVAVQITNWFRAGDGGALDVRNLSTTARSRLISNIEASFDAFDDHHRSGHRGRH